MQPNHSKSAPPQARRTICPREPSTRAATRVATEPVQCVRPKREHAPDARQAGTSALRGTQAPAPRQDRHGKSRRFEKTTGPPARPPASTPDQPAKAVHRQQANHSAPNRSVTGQQWAALLEQNRPLPAPMETSPRPAGRSEQNRPLAAVSARDRRQESPTAIGLPLAGPLAINQRSTRLDPASQRGQSLPHLTARSPRDRPRRDTKRWIATRILAQ